MKLIHTYSGTYRKEFEVVEGKHLKGTNYYGPIAYPMGMATIRFNENPRIALYKEAARHRRRHGHKNIIIIEKHIR